MKVIKIEPKDVYITFEIGLDDLKKVVRALELTQVNTDSKNDPESVICGHYLTKEFFPILAEVVDDLEREMGHGS